MSIDTPPSSPPPQLLLSYLDEILADEPIQEQGQQSGLDNEVEEQDAESSTDQETDSNSNQEQEQDQEQEQEQDQEQATIDNVAPAEKTTSYWLQECAKNPTADMLTPFYEKQRHRAAFRKLLLHWRLHNWKDRPAVCNIDMIEGTTLPEDSPDAVIVFDMRRQLKYRFHYRDLFSSLMNNLTLADELLPTPREPTNPWTNEPFTYAQIVAVAKYICRHFGKAGRCPPVIFSAFAAAQYNIKAFSDDNSSLLAQIAIRNCFKEFSAANQEILLDSMAHMLAEANINFSIVNLRRWLRSNPSPTQVQPWLHMARDYYLYINLHIQSRPEWDSNSSIWRDVRELYRNTQFNATAASERVRQLRVIVPPNTQPTPAPATQSIPSLVHLILPGLPQPDISGNIETIVALELIQQALFRL